MLRGCTATSPRSLVPYANRPFGHHGRCTKRLTSALRRLTVGVRRRLIDTARARIVCRAGSAKRLSVRPSVRPSVCPVNRQQQRPAAGLLLRRAPRGQEISIDSWRRRSAAAGSVTLTADVGGGSQTCSDCGKSTTIDSYGFIIFKSQRIVWSGGVVVRALDLRLRRSCVRLSALRFQVTTLGKLFTHTRASVAKQYNLVPVKGR